MGGTERPDKPYCFVIMPYGRTADEIRWFKGWYEQVVSPAISKSGYRSILSVRQNTPNAITDEIRGYLATAEMVVADLGGMVPADPPNPNVMYELGLRHAFNLPVVMMAWEGQLLPFDIGSQRVLIERREIIDIPKNQERLVEFIAQAESGNYYRPMDAVARSASLDAAEAQLDESSVLHSLVQEVREVKEKVEAVHGSGGAPSIVYVNKLRIGDCIPPKFISAVMEAFSESGGSKGQWARITRTYAPDDLLMVSKYWKREDAVSFGKFMASVLPKSVSEFSIIESAASQFARSGGSKQLGLEALEETDGS